MAAFCHISPPGPPGVQAVAASCPMVPRSRDIGLCRRGIRRGVMKVTRGTSRRGVSGSVARSGHRAISESRETRGSLSFQHCTVPLGTTDRVWVRQWAMTGRARACVRRLGSGIVGGAIRCRRVLRRVRPRGARPPRARFLARAASGRARQRAGRARIRSDRTSPPGAAGSRCRQCPRCLSRASVFLAMSCGGAG
jgi:hypothetical protein